ncbi:hypothetical protein [Sinomonas sp. P47F7]|uniref:hypothetical protein n=1 Tax=Sinomonas sp. P47F7 TaxID=3410987 RepID=UPI003BF4C859
MSAVGLLYAAVYEVVDEDSLTRDVLTEAKLRWVDDVIDLGCRPTGDEVPEISIAQADECTWVQISAPVERTSDCTWPDGTPYLTNAQRTAVAR